VESYRSQVNRAKLDLSIEARRGAVAKREWDSFGEMDVTDEQRALAQREPQLEATRLALKAAQSALKKAQLDLTRTTIRAPFNAMVVTESVDPGQLISPQTAVARLVGTDEYHVQVSVPVSSLRSARVRTPDEPGSDAKIVQRVGQETIERAGEVIRQFPDLDPGGAMARLLVNIDNPLGQRGDLPLLLGSFVDVSIGAQPIDDAIRLPRVALRNGRNVYVMNDQDLLEIREVQIAWTEPDAVLVTGGLETNDRVITSRIPTPVPNMLLRTAEPKSEPSLDGPSEPEAHAAP
jgi:RND family efflux transporter MFP subunit